MNSQLLRWLTQIRADKHKLFYLIHKQQRALVSLGLLVTVCITNLEEQTLTASRYVHVF